MKRFNANIDLSVVDDGQRFVLSVSLPELLTLYCAAKPAKRPHIRDYRLKKWRKQFAGFSAWELTPAHIRAMVAQFDAQDYADCTINREIADIAGCYEWASRKRHCPGGFLNPCREYEQRKDKPRQVELSAAERESLLAAAKLSPWPKMYALVLTALHTGGRKSELLGLKWADIDFGARRATLHDTKSGKPRRLLMTRECMAAIRDIQPRPCHDGMLLFCGRNVFRPHDFRKAWERCRADASLPQLHFHDLRHAACAAMLKSGAGIHAVASVMGHSDTRMISQRYGHLDDDHLQDLVDTTWGGGE